MLPEYSATIASAGMPSCARYAPPSRSGVIACASIQFGSSTARAGSTPLSLASASMRSEMVETRSKRRISQRSARATARRSQAP